MDRQPSVVVLDASCLLNLYATGRMREIVVAQPFTLAIADPVLRQETLYVRATNPATEEEEHVDVDLSPLIQDQLIQVVELQGEPEIGTFVDLSADMDDGEAVTAAIALLRGYGIATDDRKARRVLFQRDPNVGVLSTLELLKRWSEHARIAPRELRAAMAAMESGANYIPGERDPLYGWWRAAMDTVD